MKKKDKILLVLIGVIVLVIVFVLLAQNRKTEGEERIWIARPESGTKEQKISLTIEESKEDWTLEVKPREKSIEETESAFSETLEILKVSYGLCQENKTVLAEALVLPQYIAETGVSIRWESSDESILSDRGEVYRGALGTTSQEVCLRARAGFGEEMREYWFPVEVLPYDAGSKEALVYDAVKELSVLEEETAKENGFYLPDKIGEVTIALPEQSISGFGVLAGVAAVFPFLCIIAKRQDKEKERKKRKEELLGAYPRLITKLTLYTGAGLSLRGAWERLGMEYREKVIAEKKEDALAEEVCLLTGELLNGQSEMRAYEAFGKRIGLKPYLRLASLMVNHLQKGSGGLWKGLEQEVQNAWESHREHAARKGEEAQTKLLFPMMGMLFLVMAVIMVPAFFSM